MPRILALLLALPVLELVAFVLVAAAIGVGKALLLQLAISAIGIAMLGSLVTEAKSRSRSEPGFLSFVLDGSRGLRGLAGLLFTIPGFITDILGVLALVPEVRRRLRSFIGGGAAQERVKPAAARPAGTLELDQREWREVEPTLRPDR